MHHSNFYRLTGSRIRTLGPQIYALWSAKSRRIAQHTALACKLVTYNFAHVRNYLNSKTRKLFNSEDQDMIVALNFLSSGVFLMFGACLFCFICMLGGIIEQNVLKLIFLGIS